MYICADEHKVLNHYIKILDKLHNMPDLMSEEQIVSLIGTNEYPYKMYLADGYEDKYSKYIFLKFISRDFLIYHKSLAAWEKYNS